MGTVTASLVLSRLSEFEKATVSLLVTRCAAVFDNRLTLPHSHFKHDEPDNEQPGAGIDEVSADDAGNEDFKFFAVDREDPHEFVDEPENEGDLDEAVQLQDNRAPLLAFLP